VARLGGAVLHKSLPSRAPRSGHKCYSKLAHLGVAVDDDPQVLVALRNLLEPWGLKVLTLDDPAILETLEESADLLVLDVEMPQLNGIELCRGTQ